MKLCTRCVLPESYDEIIFDSDGVCNFCLDHEKKETNELFSSEEDLKAHLKELKNPESKYDILVPVSGGVDSCWTLIKMVETFGLTPLVFHNDHGFEYSAATENVKKLCCKYDLDLLIFQHEHSFMKKIWNSLMEYEGTKSSYFCFICGSILTATAVELASTFKIPMIVNGFTKGQAEMCRLEGKGENWVNDYGRWMSQNPSWQSLLAEYLEKTSIFRNADFFENTNYSHIDNTSNKITILPFYIFRFYKTDKKKLMKECMDRFEWLPQNESYPANTTNCRMNWLSAQMDLQKRGCTWYHEEYSVLIRNGEISRDQALKDLEFNPPEGMIESIIKELSHYPSKADLPAFKI